MRTLLLVLLTSLIAAHGQAFSVADWERDARQALIAGDAAAFKKLMDTRGISKRVLRREATPDRVALEKARDLFAKGQFEAAIESYNQVGKDSPNWLEAIEEKGWAFHRQGDFEKSLAQTKTLVTPVFLPIVGSEAFFLKALNELKICDYKEIFKTTQLFKETQRERIVRLQEMSKKGSTAALASVVAKATTFPLTAATMGEDVKTLPHLFYRDQALQRHLLALKFAEAARNLKSVPAKTAQLGKARDKAVARIEKAGAGALQRAGKRLAILAKVETTENFEIVQKLNLIEIETIQRIHTDLGIDKESFRKGKFRSVSRDELVFPDDGHPWMDELDKYEVQANICPQDLRRRM